MVWLTLLNGLTLHCCNDKNLLEELVAKRGEAGKSFSVYEVFASGLLGPDEDAAAW